jgi:hypothetical protein
VKQRRKKGECVEEMARKILEALHLPIYATQSVISTHTDKKSLLFRGKIASNEGTVITFTLRVF